MDQHKDAVWHRMLEGREKGIEGIKGVTCKSFADISERSSCMTDTPVGTQRLQLGKLGILASKEKKL